MAAEHRSGSLYTKIVRPRRADAAYVRNDELESRELLRTKHVGRVVCTLHGLPAVLPVNYAVVDENIFLRARPPTPLAINLPGAVIALVVDEFEHQWMGGWLVVVTGLCVVAAGPTFPPPMMTAFPFWAETSPPWFAMDSATSLWHCTRTV